MADSQHSTHGFAVWTLREKADRFEETDNPETAEVLRSAAAALVSLEEQLETLRADLYAVWDNPKIAHLDQWFYDIAEKYGWALDGSNASSERRVERLYVEGVNPRGHREEHIPASEPEGQ